MTLHDLLTDAERELVTQRLTLAMASAAYDVPDHLREGLVRYFKDGVLPGSFLQAVLCNDLTQAVSRADPRAFAGLRRLVEFLMWEAPLQSWGSRVRVLAWTTTPDRLEV